MTGLEKEYMPTKEVKATLKISGCDVMHLRESGQIEFVKQGNAFLYLRADVERLEKEMAKD